MLKKKKFEKHWKAKEEKKKNQRYNHDDKTMVRKPPFWPFSFRAVGHRRLWSGLSPPTPPKKAKLDWREICNTPFKTRTR